MENRIVKGEEIRDDDDDVECVRGGEGGKRQQQKDILN